MDPPPSAELGQHDRGLRPGELLADTHSGSGTERQEGAAWLAGQPSDRSGRIARAHGAASAEAGTAQALPTNAGRDATVRD